MTTSEHKVTGPGERTSVAFRRRKMRSIAVLRKACRSRFRLQPIQVQDPLENSRTCFEGPFGEVIRATGPMAKANPCRFSTKYQDDETDLLYYDYRYLNTSTGRWLSRDPMQEDGGLSLYAFVCNDSVDFLDLFGLVDYKFEVVTGDPFSPTSIDAFSGKWGQPWFCASGDYLVMGASAYSSVTIVSRSKPWPIGAGNACNSVDKPNPAGTIILYLRDECPGSYEVSIRGMVQLTTTGRYGMAAAKLLGGGRYLINGKAAAHAGPFEQDDLFDFTTYVGKQWTIAATYIPTVVEPPDKGVKNTGTAYGLISFISAARR